jgi:PAS domain S-box-containing protein
MPDETNEFSSTMRINIPPDLLSGEAGDFLKGDTTRVYKARTGQKARKDKPQAESLYQQLLQSIYDGCLIADLNGMVVDANTRVLGFLQMELQDVRGLNVIHFISGADDKLVPSIREALQSDRFVLLQAHCSRRDKSLFPAEISINILDADEPRLCFFVRDITERKRAEAEREKLITDLKKAISEVKTLSGLLPICASCKRIRDDGGYWSQIELYFKTRSDVQFSHGLCPECIEKLYPGQDASSENPS